MKTVRLQKFLADAGLTSRRAAEDWIRQGRVTVNGKRVTEMGVRVNPDRDQVKVDERPVSPAATRFYVLLNKPRSCLTTARDPRGRPTVFDHLPDFEVRLFPVGRLDWDASGLLLLTNDGPLAHRLMQEKIELGRNPMDISYEASVEATRMMIAALGPGYQPLTMVWGMPVVAMFHAGANTAMPHGLSTAAGVRRGDVLVTGAGADVGGYNSELERTMIVGEPSPEFVKYFDLMLQLQQAGFDALRPGRTFAEAEADVCRAFKELGVAELQRHHTGHGIGLEGHEWPFIDKGSTDVVIEENMVLSVEPGLYVPGLAGFRHSDTVVIRKGGAERLTYYPRDLDSLIVRV